MKIDFRNGVAPLFIHAVVIDQEQSSMSEFSLAILEKQRFSVQFCIQRALFQKGSIFSAPLELCAEIDRFS